MKKTALVFTVIITILTTGLAFSKDIENGELVNAIKLYKAGNYSECYLNIQDIIKNDPTNPLAYYYMAISAVQLGKKDEAIKNYEKAITLSPQNNNLSRYAKKGKRCIETPDKCENSFYDTLEEDFILNKYAPKFSEQVKGDYERLKIENLMREMNRTDSIDSEKFKEYPDFSSNPSNDEIVAALRTLQRAGFGNLLNNSQNDLSILTGNTQQNTLLNMMGTSSLNPQLIHALLTNNMTQGF